MSFTNLTSGDISDFVAAQDELRVQAGTVALFGVPTDPTWPGGTAINPDTNMPYDATIVPTNPEYVQVPVTVLIIEKQGSPLRPGADPNTFQPSGLREGMDVIMDVSVADWEATVSNASTFTVLGEDFMIVEHKAFSLGNETYRYLIYGQAR